MDGYTNHTWNGLTCYELATRILDMVEHGTFHAGVQHWGASDVVTKAEMVRTLSDTYGRFLTVNPVAHGEDRHMHLELDVNVGKTVGAMIREQFLWWRSREHIAGKRITIIGGTGSLGHHLTRFYGERNTIQVVSRDELKQLKMERTFPGIRTHLGDMRDHAAICKALRAFDQIGRAHV